MLYGCKCVFEEGWGVRGGGGISINLFSDETTKDFMFYYKKMDSHNRWLDE